MKKMPSSTVVGVTWYTEESWVRVKASASDPERFEATYAEWTAMALKSLANFRKAGVNAVKFMVNPDELLPWCMLNNKPNNATSRAEFVSERLHFQHSAGT